jgi:hypothetical protein
MAETDMAQGTTGRSAPIAEVIDGLNDLLQLDHDAIGAYQIAIEKLDDRDHADQIRGFQLDHERHVRALNQLITELGGTPINEPHKTGPFKEALQSLGALAGDRGLLMAWRTNELQVRTKYDSYASKAMFWPTAVKRIVDRNALDEERHYRWVVEVLGGDADADPASKLRERRNVMGGNVSHRAGEMAAGARNRVADALAGAANRIEGLSDERGGRMSGAAHRVAGGMDSAADYVREGDMTPGGMRDDLETRIRESPLQTLLLLFAVGFVIGRILR